MNLRNVISRGLILPVVLACISPVTATAAPSRTYAYDGTVANICQVGAATSYSVSIAVTNLGQGQMGTAISLDGTTGAQQTKNNQDATVTKNYVTICNLTTQKTLTLNAPKAISGGNNIVYTFTVFNGMSGSGATVASVATEPGSASVIIPAQTSATWSIVVTATNKNSLAAGTYTATVTIQ